LTFSDLLWYRLTMNFSEVAKVIKYNPDTGEIVRTDRRNSTGSKDSYGYTVLKYKGSQFKLHRVIWFIMTGSEPNGVIDHINGIRDDNRWVNLRDVPQSVNVKNTHVKNKDTGCVGIHLDKSTKGLIARYTTKINGKTHRFRTLEEAKEIRINNNLNV